jgi:hypothetical protein
MGDEKIAQRISWGVGEAFDGREPAKLASQIALDKLGNERPEFAIAFSSCEFLVDDVLSSLHKVLGNLPLWDFTTTLPVTKNGEQPRAVVVALI